MKKPCDIGNVWGYYTTVTFNKLIARPAQKPSEYDYRQEFEQDYKVETFANETIIIKDAKSKPLALMVKGILKEENLKISKEIVDQANTYRPIPSKFDKTRVPGNEDLEDYSDPTARLTYHVCSGWIRLGAKV